MVGIESGVLIDPEHGSGRRELSHMFLDGRKRLVRNDSREAVAPWILAALKADGVRVASRLMM